MSLPVRNTEATGLGHVVIGQAFSEMDEMWLSSNLIACLVKTLADHSIVSEREAWFVHTTH
jgi:hypothetical protein